MHIRIVGTYILFLFLFFGNLPGIYGQRVSKRDSVLKSKAEMSLRDSIFIVARDTIVFLMDTVTEGKRKEGYNGSRFFRNLKKGAYKRKLTKELYRLLFVSPRKMNPTDTLKTERSETGFVQYQGKSIRGISIRVLEPFGSDLQDTTKTATSWAETTANKLHHTSRRGHLRRLLRINEGDRLDAYTIADNERLIRQLSYVKDAYFRVVPVPGSDSLVDLQLWAKDQFSWGADLDVGSLTSTEFEIYSRNLYGIGHEFSNSFQYESDKDQRFGYTGRYTIRNIRRSYIDVTLGYQDTHEKAVVGIEFNRRFETFNTKYAGGLSFSRTMRSDKIMVDDPILNEIPLDFNYGNVWLGRSYKMKSDNLFKRRRLVVAGRVASREFFKRPEVGPGLNRFFHNNTLYLASLSFTQNQYYKSNLIYNFGRTEDIPYGFLSRLTIGYENREFSHRQYLGLDFQKANFIKKNRSYFFNRLAIGGYLRSKRFEQGILLAQTKFFSRIRRYGPLRVRKFVDLKYTLGIRRFPGEFIGLNNRNGIRGFSSDEVKGTQKIGLNLESVAFTPYVVGGFRLAFFSFADIGIIGSNRRNIFREDYYYGLGLGIRLNNENLVFRTIQFRFAFYPNAPSDFGTTGYRLAGEERPKFNDFKVAQPDIFRFE